MADSIQGAQAPATETTQSASAPEQLSAADVKKLPWVQTALKAQSELEKLKLAEKAREEKAVADKLAAEGKYAEAIAAADARVKALETQFAAEKRSTDATVALLAAGLVDRRAATLFIGDWAEGETVDQFAQRVKAEPHNALYFSAVRTPMTGPGPASGGAVPTLTLETARAQLQDPDLAKRAIAKKWLRDYYLATNNSR